MKCITTDICHYSKRFNVTKYELEDKMVLLAIRAVLLDTVIT